MNITDWIFLTIIVIAVCVTVYSILENYFYYKLERLGHNKETKEDEEE